MNKYEAFVGKVLDGRYKILELVGIGGMACVLKAQDLVMNRIVAIKILNDEYNGDELAEARFIDESKAVAMLSNKNIVSVYDVAIYPDIKYIVMEYLDGITMREYLDNKGAIGWKEACIYILQILRALEHAHSKGIIHRDIKPQNVILMKNGDIKVTDFGIAKLPNETSPQKDDKAIGTVYYISPEQACGKETGYYSDIYSVGVMLYEAVTGTLPFIADTPMEVAMLQVNREPVNPRDINIDIPVGVSQIILKAMEKSPADRFASAHSMAKAIEWILRNPDVIFSMTSTGAEESPAGKTSVVSIDMIDTTEIQPYGEDEIAESLGTEKRVKNAKQPEKKQKKTKKSKTGKTNRSMFPIIVGVTLAFMIVALIIGVLMILNVVNDYHDLGEQPEVEYPNIVGELYNQQLISNLSNGSYGAKFVINDKTEINYVNRDDVENNRIISTEPSAGHLSRPDSTKSLYFTTITVNRSQKVTVPYLSGYSKSYAETMLKNLELKCDIVDQPVPENEFYFDNQVTATYPEGGSEAKVGDTVTIYIRTRGASANDSTAKMPNVVGMTPYDARRYAEQYALYKVTIEEIETEDGEGKVVQQSIKAGTVSKKGTEVVLTVAMPLTAPLMPDLTGLTLDQARALFEDITPFNNVNSFGLFFKVSEDYYDLVLDTASKETEVFACGDALVDLGCERIDESEDEGEGIIVFQNIDVGDPITEKSSIRYVVVVFTESENSTDPGDESSDGDNSDESSGPATGDESSENAVDNG